MNNIYSYSDTQEFIDHLVDDLNYEFIVIDDGCLAIGNAILIPPNDDYYYFEISEVFLNEWSSGQKIRKFSKLSQRQLKLLESVGY